MLDVIFVYAFCDNVKNKDIRNILIQKEENLESKIDSRI
jgi:hypothetical protein